MLTVPLCPCVCVFACRHFMYLPLVKQKLCVNVLCHFEDRTYRMFNSNMLDSVARLFVRSHTHTQTSFKFS